MKLGSERIQGGIKTEEEQSEEKKTLLTQTVQRQKYTDLCMGIYNDTVFSNNCFQTLSVFHVNEGKSELFKELLEEMCRVRQR